MTATRITPFLPLVESKGDIELKSRLGRRKREVSTKKWAGTQDDFTSLTDEIPQPSKIRAGVFHTPYTHLPLTMREMERRGFFGRVICEDPTGYCRIVEKLFGKACGVRVGDIFEDYFFFRSSDCHVMIFIFCHVFFYIGEGKWKVRGKKKGKYLFKFAPIWETT